MIRRIQTIRRGERSEAVANLHSALTVLGFPVDAGEREEKHAGDDTARVVRILQQQMNIAEHPELLVDDISVATFNFYLGNQGLLSDKVPRPYTVAGVVSDATGKPVRGIAVTAYHQVLRGREALGAATSDVNGRY